jgi:hypothetical protein
MAEANDATQGLQRRIESLYHPSGDDGEIIVYAGDLQLSKEGTDWLAGGNLELRLSPSPVFEARFAGREQWMLDPQAGWDVAVGLPPHSSLEPPTQSAIPAQPDDDQWWVVNLPINVDELEAGQTNSIERLILHIVGAFPSFPMPEYQTSSGSQGQLPFALPGWSLRLAEAAGPRSDDDFSFVVEAVPQTTPVSRGEIHLLARRVFMLLSFVAGGEVGVGPRVGLDAGGQVVWGWWGAPRVAQHRPSWRWCPDQLVNETLPILADGLTSLAADPGLEACLDRAVNLLLTANGPGVLDVRIPFACSGLELLAWAVLQHHQWVSPDDLARLNAGSSARLLLQWAQIPVGLPAESAALQARRGRVGQPSDAGPEMVFAVRNGVIHPPKRLSDPEWPTSDELFEAWQLATWYLELVILRLLGYNGEYVSRLQLHGWVGQTEPVPWQQP